MPKYLHPDVYIEELPSVARGFGKDPVAVFTEPDLGGDYQFFTEPGRYDIDALTIPDDSIRSLLVPVGYKVTLFEHAGFSGERVVVHAATEVLAGGIEGKVSSLIITETTV
ncbi:hypothetical protein [Streptomyces agglomeratus]|uniref:hypothetical protein n=1 Tax=Streptomyces agglomeratus TaxID=285458 RepID=UPI00114CA483|nr:hypothetical protein [Streptomyces agglomeratus]